jgi:hypothetical protein
MYEHGWWWEETRAPLDHVGPLVSAVGLVLYRGMHSFVISHSPSSPVLLVLCGTVSCSCAIEWVNDWLWNVCLISCFSCCFGFLQNPLVSLYFCFVNPCSASCGVLLPINSSWAYCLITKSKMSQLPYNLLVVAVCWSNKLVLAVYFLVVVIIWLGF